MKSAAYLQAWGQAIPSRISFRGLKAQAWDDRTGYSGAATYNADVYVFCVQTALTHDAYDPLDVDQWEFYVLPVETVRAINQKEIGLARVRTLTQAVAFRDLAAGIERTTDVQSEPNS
ncbi:hypothetical protein [Kribbella sp. VKM Ac-2566]|uniref:hypothetical protein n=1 Tax=Kribbella sp. VKM Ac-2566 TaxID=2512218 RepID=UPI0010629691|nr:hypothetical protein [Kribbella sp. VKM Ac-2566]